MHKARQKIIFLILELRIFSLKLGKNIFFCHLVDGIMIVDYVIGASKESGREMTSE